jgi:lipopolysaccharide export system protein LptA
VTPDRNARGDHAVYTQADDQIVMTGDVIVVQGQDVARGDKLIINVAAHQARMVSAATGLGKPGRVRGVYFPDKAAPATPAAKP